MCPLTRGELAKHCRVNSETIRYYERQGLIPKPPRSAANYRLYGEDTVRRVHFIQRAKELGFTLREIRELFSLRAEPRARCSDVLERAEAKIREIDEKIRDLEGMRRAIVRLEKECRGDLPISDCAIIRALDRDLDERTE